MLQAFGKILEVIDRLQILPVDFARISTSSFKKFPERLPNARRFWNVNIFHYSKNFFRSINQVERFFNDKF